MKVTLDYIIAIFVSPEAGKLSDFNVKCETQTLLSVQNYILRAIDNGKAVFLVLLDLSAAFDTLNPNIMLNRFQSYEGHSICFET